MSTETQRRVTILRDLGVSMIQIAGRLGVSRAAVYHWLDGAKAPANEYLVNKELDAMIEDVRAKQPIAE